MKINARWTLPVYPLFENEKSNEGGGGANAKIRYAQMLKSIPLPLETMQ